MRLRKQRAIRSFPQTGTAFQLLRLFTSLLFVASPTISLRPPLGLTGECVFNAASPAMCELTAHPSEPCEPVNSSLQPQQPELPPHRIWESSEHDSPQTAPLTVKGKLKSCLPFWIKDLKASALVVETIAYGYKIPFKYLPSSFFAKNNKSSLDHSDFVDSAISELLIKHCIIEVDTIPLCCNPLTVAKVNKLRLVLDLRHPNQFISLTPFKYEDLKHIAQVLHSGQHYLSFDFESGYHHIDIFPLHQQYLGFSWTHLNCTKYYVFTVLPFGLSSACYIFTKVVRPLVYYWRAQGILSFVYIDDGLIISPTRLSALRNLDIVKETISRSGFVLSKTKCVWTPITNIHYLGFFIDSTTSKFYIGEAKLAKLLSSINYLMVQFTAGQLISVRKLASIAGQVIAMSPALGPIARLMTRSCYHAIESRVSWTSLINLPSSVTAELEFWIQNIKLLNGFPFKFRLVPTIQISSDASATGYGGFVHGKSDMRLHGIWSVSEKLNSSTWRELTAVLRILIECQSYLINQKIKWFTDNANVPSIIKCGSTTSNLHEIALSIYKLCRLNNIVIVPEWLPRNENRLADKISKFVDFDDWSIDDHSFAIIDTCWGPHSIDRFASPQNRKLQAFNARFWCKGVSGVDAFCQDWSVHNNYFCPPVSLISQVIRLMEYSKAVGTLVVPKWPSSHFWPLLCPDGSHLNKHVFDWKLMNISFIPPSLGKVSPFNSEPSFLTLALRWDFSKSPRQTNRGYCCSELGYCSDCI